MEEGETAVDFDCREVTYGFGELGELVLEQTGPSGWLSHSKGAVVRVFQRGCSDR